MICLDNELVLDRVDRVNRIIKWGELGWERLKYE